MIDPRAVDPERLGYAEALAELEGILGELERDDVDVDVLADRVARAAALIRVCRGRLDATKVEVERVLAELDDVTPDSDE